MLPDLSMTYTKVSASARMPKNSVTPRLAAPDSEPGSATGPVGASNPPPV